MKRIYQTPTIKTVKVEYNSMLCASGDPTIGGNVGGDFGIGEGEPPSVANSKSYSPFGDNVFDTSFED